MALTKSAQTPQASASNTAGSTTTSSALTIGYGVSGVGKITNGGTGPTVGCDFVLLVSNNGSTFIEWTRQTAGTANSGVYPFDYSLGVGGNGGDWTHYQTQFTGNTGQSVTIQADACSTTAL